MVGNFMKKNKVSETIKKENETVKGRPLKQVDEKLVKDLASIFCTMAEMAAIVGVSVDTLERRYTEAIKRGRETAKSSLRRLQWKAAKKGSTAILIWLGKNYLGQREPSSLMFEPAGDKKINFDMAVVGKAMVEFGGCVTPSKSVS